MYSNILVYQLYKSEQRRQKFLKFSNLKFNNSKYHLLKGLLVFPINALHIVHEALECHILFKTKLMINIRIQTFPDCKFATSSQFGESQNHLNYNVHSKPKLLHLYKNSEQLLIFR
ncbi:hypothetical protein R6Q59_027125 [Mikania micrantha]